MTSPRTVTATPVRRPARNVLPRQRSNDQQGTTRRPGGKSDKVFLVSNGNAGAAWLDTLLKALGLRDVDAAAMVSDLSPADPINPSVINKWRRGISLPTLPKLRVLIHAIQPRAKMVNIEVTPLDAFLRFGLLEPGDVEQSEIPVVYRDAIELDRQLPPAKQLQMRTTVQLVINGLRSELDTPVAAPKRRRSAS